MLGGEVVESIPTAEQARRHAAASMAKLPASVFSLFAGDPWRVEQSPELTRLFERVRTGVAP
jgi:hypothetical protein